MAVDWRQLNLEREYVQTVCHFSQNFIYNKNFEKFNHDNDVTFEKSAGDHKTETKKEGKKGNRPKAKAWPLGDMSCLLTMIKPTELITFIAQAPTLEKADECFFSASIVAIQMEY